MFCSKVLGPRLRFNIDFFSFMHVGMLESYLTKKNKEDTDELLWEYVRLVQSCHIQAINVDFSKTFEDAAVSIPFW